MSRNQMEFETANGEMITLELSDETRAACNSYFVAAARTLLENYRKVEFEMRTAKHQLEDLKARGEKGGLPHRLLSKTEVIEMMCHPGVSTDCERVKSSSISDPTARIALNYEKEYDRLMAELNDEPAYYKEQLSMLESRYLEKKSVVDFISTTISGMDEKTSLVARMLWIEDQGWDAIADALHVRSHTTISRIKDKAIIYMAGVLEERENNKLRIMLG